LWFSLTCGSRDSANLTTGGGRSSENQNWLPPSPYSLGGPFLIWHMIGQFSTACCLLFIYMGHVQKMNMAPSGWPPLSSEPPTAHAPPPAPAFPFPWPAPGAHSHSHSRPAPLLLVPCSLLLAPPPCVLRLDVVGCVLQSTRMNCLQPSTLVVERLRADFLVELFDTPALARRGGQACDFVQAS
jgi:hypothetical protein